MNGTQSRTGKRIAGVSYAVADNGMELPILDITHPLFVASIDESRLDELGKQAMAKARDFRKLPEFYKRFLAKRSFILSGMLFPESHGAYLNGMSTMMTKLGPGLIGGGWGRFFDRKVSQGFGPMTHRMRLRDICRMQADELMPLLRESPGKKLCFISIAGGPASDSLNTLFLIQEKEPGLVAGRPIEIAILDIDSLGPHFAEASVRSLCQPRGRLHGLDVSTRVVSYDWNDAAILRDVLRSRRECIMVGASEGGLFVYGSDEAIRKTLSAFADHAPQALLVVGDVGRDEDSVHPSVPAMSALLGFNTRFLGIEGLKKILEGTAWRIGRTMEGSPVDITFSLTR
jgi:hypothetical protein